ncbi:sphingomyelin synthase-related protein 1-like [Strongylocentrotus purpuratus]|uniref:Sphingomyelin synthase-like domain-containing protein n=1 Tax=Strongylocentrotus purpuratus TaxID=7668 RepID=A0A7M7T081_STRPU|nr:sphingomyelin synthase-related protein 1-like [Strongylocentrotus purpuratus]
MTSDYQNGRHHQQTEKPLLPEYWKTLVSCLYLNLVSFSMCYAVTVTHQAAPDRRVHPPLPDAIMDNVPYIPWGTQGAEVCTMVLGVVLILVCVVHKHRTIICRRFCAIMATIYIMRIATILSTALPVLPPPSECTTMEMDTAANRLNIAIAVWMKSGSRLSGIKMCGDYMFSGHITSLTLGNLFIIEYTPSRLFFIRYLTTAVNIAGSIVIIIGRGHYTVDVIIAIILVFIVFQYYHSLTRLYVLTKSSEKLQWFPFFLYFERNVCLTVPNEYESPQLSNLLSTILGKFKGNI